MEYFSGIIDYSISSALTSLNSGNNSVLDGDGQVIEKESDRIKETKPHRG